MYTPYPNVSEITENLLLCSAFVVNGNLLNALNVTCIINAALELPYLPPENASIEYRRVPIADACTSNIYPYFDEIADIIYKVRIKTLVIIES